MDTFRRDGLTFDVREGGPRDGDAVVLLHGFRRTRPRGPGWNHCCTATACALSPPTSAATPPAPARPAGRSAYRLSETVADVLALLDAAGLERAHVVGHDWGAAVAWALAAWNPGRVQTVTALSVPHPGAMARAMVTSDQALRSYYMGLFQLPLLPERLILANEAAPLRRLLSRGGLPDDAVRRYVDRMREPGALTAALGWYRAMPWSARQRVGKIRVPTLHLWSTGDAFLGRAATEDTARFVDAPYRLEVLRGVSHWIPELAPDVVADLVTAHVRAS